MDGSKRTRWTACAIGMVVVLGALSPGAALGQTGAPAVDQAFTDPGDPTGGSSLLPSSGLFGNVFGDHAIVGQTFTAGRDGVLTGINLDLYQPNDPAVPSAPVRVSITNTETLFAQTVPGATEFTSTVLPSQVVPLAQVIVFPQLLELQARTKYAIVLDLVNPSPNDAGGVIGAAGTGGYAQGASCGRRDGQNWICPDTQSQQFDNHFRTCMSPGPAAGDGGPSAVDDPATVLKGSGTTTIDVLGNDNNDAGGPMALVGLTEPDHGSAAITDCGAALTYTPKATYAGPDAFTYTLNGGSTARVSVTVKDPAVGSDTRPPETSIVKGAPDRTEKTSIKLKFTADEQGATFECMLDRQSWRSCTSPKTLKHLDAGKHTFQVRATDASRNTDATPAKDKFKVVGD